jgi:VanZ family protein
MRICIAPDALLHLARSRVGIRRRSKQEHGNAHADTSQRMAMNATKPRGRKRWAVASIVVAAVLFWVATSNPMYELTSPFELSWHVALRKAYSIGAFALVGFTTDKALGPSARPVLRAVFVGALYSGAIEITQAFQGSDEGLTWNAIDVTCGAFGGWLGAMFGHMTGSHRKP